MNFVVLIARNENNNVFGYSARIRIFSQLILIKMLLLDFSIHTFLQNIELLKVIIVY